ncbi:MAG: hypothetical protein KC445_00900 [Anaerolineales bacterium]|nr:hypothetical protein [Anaerolineales bacterium]
MSENQYRAVKISPGKRGWGGPLIIQPTEKKPYIYCVTGGGIHPVAQRIADLTGGIAFDGFKSKREFDELAVAVIDCGGTARVGVYPMKGVPTVDIHSTKPSGPLFRFIKEDIFVSGVTEAEITLVDGETPPPVAAAAPEPAPAAEPKQPAPAAKAESKEEPKKKKGFMSRLFGG